MHSRNPTVRNVKCGFDVCMAGCCTIIMSHELDAYGYMIVGEDCRFLMLDAQDGETSFRWWQRQKASSFSIAVHFPGWREC